MRKTAQVRWIFAAKVKMRNDSLLKDYAVDIIAISMIQRKS
ncbi:hypothetical protein [Arcanobacterium hippocoleae]|uniref:Uncharacterized protein n=1 Tax=Arcanobacterium hippocoleae TaxID=149017 RepID=A0ABU1T1C7_9ACTO|nr:hypothetical protein [Arcanobacterium hippocoleae]MDR6939182.1 hypothetical protein [Arcanobacterium hippocoleae]